MQLASFEQVPTYRVLHSQGVFADQNEKHRPLRVLQCVLLDYRFGRKKFVKSSDGKWGVECVSGDSIVGHPADGEDLECNSSINFCDGCKPFLLVAGVNHDGPFLLELSATVAKKLYDEVSALVNAGLTLDTYNYTLKLGQTKSSRVNFSQLVVNKTDRSAITTVDVSDSNVQSALQELDERHRSSYARPGKPAGRASIESGELTLPQAR